MQPTFMEEELFGITEEIKFWSYLTLELEHKGFQIAAYAWDILSGKDYIQYYFNRGEDKEGFTAMDEEDCYALI